MDYNLPFNLFSSCIIVKGVNRSTICDLQRNRVHLIPNSLSKILEDCNGSTILEVKSKFEIEDEHVINEYFEFLKQEELIFFSTKPEWFPKMSLQWDSPLAINNCIIDIDNCSKLSFSEIFRSLNILGCQFLEIRSYSVFDISFYESICAHAEGSTIISIGFIVPYNQNYTLADWDSFCDNNVRVTSLVIHTSNKHENTTSTRLSIPIVFSDKIILDEKCCGIISDDYFTAYIETFTESLKHNSCLNKKISIDRNGNIKNCPSMAQNFGNIVDTQLENVIAFPEFKKFWNINKDKINICSDCEFRHVCTDCRAYIENPKDSYSKPLKCGYDPYTCEWEDWSTLPFKQNAIKFYGLIKVENQ
ncbi:grasp-with-spasm system SPASM domain peptide maturase [Pedobacter sp. GR22-10]|uniref:grasp-with-spasm system SPASM domain peptide maturase n=1 Tax=Pedobacter sp. GR22-10 TaxID=2994472 RepID=UPI002247096A|nr:grasp-with-spasm system SPASM domain peptide maturase [Pedobacter sp. GR22-10]MCX2429850.1 grasp-with-spasm system SPASM domain peptide maturase [Pedobacter sp. GR22-10]